MRCECCDRILSDSEATSKFAGSGLFTNMCKTCQGFMPKELKVVTRSDLEEEESNYLASLATDILEENEVPNDEDEE